MDSIKQTFQKYQEIFMARPGSQRFAMVVITLAVAGGFGFLIFRGTSGRYVPASLGKSFSTEEMRNAQEILRGKGLTDFREESGKLMVPKVDVDRYNAALLEEGGLPDGWSSELQKQRDKSGWFPSARQSKAGEKIALAKELRRIIRALPDVADGSVVWAASEPRRFGAKQPRVTATVNLKPKPGRELPMRLIQSLRVAVASMVPDLKPADVTVFDIATQQSYTLDKDDPHGGWRTELIKHHTQRYSQKIEKQLSFIPGVLVTVDVKLENINGRMRQSKKLDPEGNVVSAESTEKLNDDRTNQPIQAEPGVSNNVPRSLANKGGTTEKRTLVKNGTTTRYLPSFENVYEEFAPAMIEATHVSVAIPEDYFTKVAEKAKAAAQGDGGNTQTPPTRQQIIQDVKTMVATAIGTTANDTKVDVRTFIPVDADIPELESSWLDSASTAVNQWGGAFMLGLFAVWALWMLRKNMPAVPVVETKPLIAEASEPEPEEPVVEAPPPEPTPRDVLQSKVRDNPEVAAAVLSQWLKSASIE